MMHHDADVPTTSPLMDRRNFLVAATAPLLCAPAIVRASSLMPIKVVGWTPLTLPAHEHGERPSAGWAERVAYQMMDHVLKKPERAASFYGGISESKMRSMVAHARRHNFLSRA
jgi:hypothetical protein